jgi:hypothetical protein
VAGAERPAAQIYVAGQMLGTPYYMSPEQWGELPHDAIQKLMAARTTVSARSLKSSPQTSFRRLTLASCAQRQHCAQAIV